MTNGTMTKGSRSTPSRHKSLPPSQVYTKGSRGSVKTRSEHLHSPATEPRRRVPRTPSSNSKVIEERDYCYPVTPVRQHVTIKQSTVSSEKSRFSSKSDFSDEYTNKSNNRNTPQSSMKEITKQHSRKARDVIEGKTYLQTSGSYVVIFLDLKTAFFAFDGKRIDARSRAR